MSPNLPVEAAASGRAPVAPKVISGGVGAAAGGSLGTAVIWVLGVVWGAPADAAHVAQAMSAAPWPVTALVPGALAGIGALWLGYIAPHQQRLEDVTEAIAKYVVGSNQTAPAAHDPVPVTPASTFPSAPPDDDEVGDDDTSDTPIATVGDDAVPPDAVAGP